jgi:hypothetical protein
MEFVGIPAGFVSGVYPLAEKAPLILDMSKARALLGYRDRLDVEAATRLTARWLSKNPPAPGEITSGAGTFDYAAEDAIAEAWRNATASMPLAAGGGTE